MVTAYDVVTFDCYGTLIDWESGIANAFLTAADEDGLTLDRESILRAHADVEPRIQQEGYRTYREVLIEVAMRAASALGWPLTRKRATFLPDSLASWTPFDDTNPALERLKHAGYRLGILSNIDNDLLAATRRHFTVDFDLIVTAEEVRSYKPAPAHFTTARARIGDARWLHAAQSNYHDVVPANAMGVATAWVNRHGSAALPGGTPLHEVRDLRELADLLAR